MNEFESTSIATLEIALNVAAVASMLHEAAEQNSATRLFRGEPVLSWTLRRLQQSKLIANLSIICWDDQLPAVEEIAEESHAFVLSKGPRRSLPLIEFAAASRRWSHGWRGGVGNTCHFDRGFHAESTLELLRNLEADAALLIDPAAGLVDAELIDGLIEHAAEKDSVELTFTAAAPGLTGAIARRSLLERLAKSAVLPGRLLHYMPDQPMRDPIGTDACAPAPAGIARSTRSFLLDSDRQIRSISSASVSLNGSLARSSAEQMIERFDWPTQVDPLPRELTIELNTTRRSRPIYWPGRTLQFNRARAPLDVWRRLFDEAACDDLRLTIAGVGDPLESDDFFEVIRLARSAGIEAIHVATDLLTENSARVEQLAASAIDIVSIHLPAMTSDTYTAVMGVDAMTRVLENLAAFVQARAGTSRGVPIVAPTFTKLAINLAEMEAWYDQWLRAVGTAVIVGPSDFAGQFEDFALADMSPTRRMPCRRIQSRMHILCDGSVVACEQDVLERFPIAKVGDAPLVEIWRNFLQPLRSAHALQQFNDQPLCERCKEWNRP